MEAAQAEYIEKFANPFPAAVRGGPVVGRELGSVVGSLAAYFASKGLLLPFLLSLETGEGWLDHEPSSLKSRGACVGHFVTVIKKTLLKWLNLSSWCSRYPVL